MRKRKTLGLALGAGGSRGACHVGAIQALTENDIPIDFVTGSSMGAVIGGAFASGADICEVEKRLRAAKMSELFDLNLRPIAHGGLLKGKASEKLILPFLKCETFEQTPIPFRCTAVDINTGMPYVFSSGKLITGIRASMSIPGIFEPVVFEDMLLVDGGLLDRLPTGCMRKMGPDVIISIDALGRIAPVRERPNLVSIIMRSFEIVDWDRVAKQYDDENEIILCPEFVGSQLSAKTVPAAIDAGRACVLENLDKIKKVLSIR